MPGGPGSPFQPSVVASSPNPGFDGAVTGPVDDRVQRILACVDSIPEGRISTYGEVARDAGLPGRARMVGKVLREHSRAELPWHRVLGAGHRIRVEGRAAREQARRLRREGWSVLGDRIRPK